jgi:hypothetical protein
MSASDVVDWTMTQLLRARWRVQSLTVLLAYWHSWAVQEAYTAGHREGYKRTRRQSQAEAKQRSRERAYSLGYRHGKKDARALRVVVDNPAPVDLYTGRHAATG